MCRHIQGITRVTERVRAICSFCSLVRCPWKGSYSLSLLHMTWLLAMLTSRVVDILFLLGVISAHSFQFLCFPNRLSPVEVLVLHPREGQLTLTNLFRGQTRWYPYVSRKPCSPFVHTKSLPRFRESLFPAEFLIFTGLPLYCSKEIFPFGASWRMTSRLLPAFARGTATPSIKADIQYDLVSCWN